MSCFVIFFSFKKKKKQVGDSFYYNIQRTLFFLLQYTDRVSEKLNLTYLMKKLMQTMDSPAFWESNCGRKYILTRCSPRTTGPRLFQSILPIYRLCFFSSSSDNEIEWFLLNVILTVVKHATLLVKLFFSFLCVFHFYKSDP